MRANSTLRFSVLHKLWLYAQKLPLLYSCLAWVLSTGSNYRVVNCSHKNTNSSHKRSINWNAASKDLWGWTSSSEWENVRRGQQVSRAHEALSNNLSAEHWRGSCSTSQHLRLVLQNVTHPNWEPVNQQRSALPNIKLVPVSSLQSSRRNLQLPQTAVWILHGYSQGGASSEEDQGTSWQPQQFQLPLLQLNWS